MSLTIIKRDKREVEYDRMRIHSAIKKAAKGQIADHEIKIMVDCVEGQVESRETVEHIQDLVEEQLMDAGYNEVAKKYILYRQSHKDIRDIEKLFSAVDAVEKYLKEDDWKVKENANMSYSLQGLNNYLSAKMINRYWLHKLYPKSIQNAHESGELHIHDLGTLGAYCVGWDLKDLLEIGFSGVRGKVASKPPKHLRSAFGQIVNFFYTLQGETAGAQAFSNFDTLLAPFIAADNLTYKEVKQAMQEFVFNLAVPTRVGFQTPFTNVTFDLKVPSYLASEPVIIGGEPQGTNYSQYQKEMDMLNKAFCEVMIEGDAQGRVFTFPIPTYNITKDFDWDKPEYEPLWEMTAKYGIPYFSNFVNSDMNPEDARSMCCRLRLDQTELRARGGGLFGANPQTGSIGVVTINLPRLAYESNDKSEFFRKLKHLMDLSRDSLEMKRKIIESYTNQGLYPYAKHYLRQVHQRFGSYWENHFSTIGLVGMHEALLNLYNVGLTGKEGEELAKEILEFMRTALQEYQEETGHIYNLEATPAESTSHRLARLDKKVYPAIITAGNEETPYYTNSSQLPVDHTTDIFTALDLQDGLQSMYTGGTVLHGFLGERIQPEVAKQLVKKIASNYKLPYYTITPTFSVCPKHGYLSGDHEYCPICDKLGGENENKV